MTIEILVIALKIIIAVALFFVWVVRYDNIINEFKNDYNYPDWLRDLTGILKLSFAIMLISTNTLINDIGLKGIIFLMVCAVLTHIKIRSSIYKAIPSVALIILCLIILCLG